MFTAQKLWSDTSYVLLRIINSCWHPNIRISLEVSFKDVRLHANTYGESHPIKPNNSRCLHSCPVQQGAPAAHLRRALSHKNLLSVPVHPRIPTAHRPPPAPDVCPVLTSARHFALLSDSCVLHSSITETEKCQKWGLLWCFKGPGTWFPLKPIKNKRQPWKHGKKHSTDATCVGCHIQHD